MFINGIVYLQQFLLTQYDNAYQRNQYLESLGEEWDKLIEAGAYHDSRTGIPYPTVWINDRRWFAQNILYSFRNNLYNRVKDYRHTYNIRTNSVYTDGYLYNLGSAVKACPPGTKLPSFDDFAGVFEEKKQDLLGLPSNGYYNPINKIFVGPDYGYYWTSDDIWSLGKRTALKVWRNNYYKESVYRTMECSVRPIIDENYINKTVY